LYESTAIPEQIGENSAMDRFWAAIQPHPRLQIFTVLERQDIPHIVLGQGRAISWASRPRA